MKKILMLLVCILLASCASNSPKEEAAPGTAEILSMSPAWTLHSMNGKPVPVLELSGKAPTISFMPAEGMFSAVVVNNFSGSFKVMEDGTIAIEPNMISTRKLGPRGDMDVESGFQFIFPKLTNVSYDAASGTLSLTGEGVSMTLLK